jgi:hypothetical protein
MSSGIHVKKPDWPVRKSPPSQLAFSRIVSLKFKADGFAKSSPASLRGAKRRGNLLNIRTVMRLLRFARNDKSALFGLFTKPSRLVTLISPEKSKVASDTCQGNHLVTLWR